MGKYLVIETTASLLRIPLESLVYVKAEGNYSRIFTVLDVVKGSKGTLVTYKLGWIHNSLSDVIGDVESKTIVRAGKSHIINLDFVSDQHLTTDVGLVRLRQVQCGAFRRAVKRSAESLEVRSWQ